MSPCRKPGRAVFYLHLSASGVARHHGVSFTMSRVLALLTALVVLPVISMLGAAPTDPPPAPPPGQTGGRWVWYPNDGWLWDPNSSTPAAGPTPRQPGVLVFGAATGGGPRVRVFRDLKGQPAFDIFAYDENFRGGVRLAVADINGDGVPDVVTVPGKG